MNDSHIIGDSPAFQHSLQQASALAALSKPALVIGERGTGKELIAARLHYLSPRWQHPLVKINCATLTESLLDTELFGHEAGSFTGAIKQHKGHFETAHHGSVFLDEIANTSLRLQEKLLRVIEYGEFTRVGGSQTLHTDIRIIAATNIDLPSAVAEQQFRADLLDRLAFDVITLPPLRYRKEDILPLADHFATAMASELGYAVFNGFSARCQSLFLAHGWSGNIRELKNVVERAVYRWQQPDKPIDHIDFDPFQSAFRPQRDNMSREESITNEQPLKQQVRCLEIGLIKQALIKCHYHQSKAAEQLGLSYHQLRAYLRKYPDIQVTLLANGGDS